MGDICLWIIAIGVWAIAVGISDGFTKLHRRVVSLESLVFSLIEEGRERNGKRPGGVGMRATRRKDPPNGG